MQPRRALQNENGLDMAVRRHLQSWFQPPFAENHMNFVYYQLQISERSQCLHVIMSVLSALLRNSVPVLIIQAGGYEFTDLHVPMSSVDRHNDSLSMIYSS